MKVSAQRVPDDARVLAMLGEAYMAQRDHAKATSLFQEASRADNRPDIQTGLGVTGSIQAKMKQG